MQTDGAEVEKMPTRASDQDDENGRNDQNSVLPPLYIDIQDEIERNLKIADIKFSKLKKMQAQRMKIDFDIDEKQEQKLQNDIYDLTREIMKILKEMDIELKRLRDTETEGLSDDMVKQNIITQLASRMKDMAFKFKANEKEFYVKVKDLHGDDSEDLKQR